ncbi:MAG TPA: integrin alpha [Chthoniobacteraceae bacterium]|jgi:hypothetical protein|nr:integrin alpha [Chthoniobacteraceae bacterium]
MSLGALTGANGFALKGVTAVAQTGYSVSGAGDVNGDGFDDVILGERDDVPSDNFVGHAYVVYGKATNATAAFELSALTGPNGSRLDGTGADAHAGISVSHAGDVNGDGFADLIVGAYGYNNYAGAAYIVYGRAASFGSALTLGSINGTSGAKLLGSGFDNTGHSVSSAGDVNGDGFAKSAIAALTVQSLGRLGLSTQAAGGSLQSDIQGKLGTLTVKSDIVGAFVSIAGGANAADDDSGAITIGGSIRGGSAANSGSIFAAGDLGAVKIAGSVLGGAGPHSGSVEAGGAIASIGLGDSLISGSFLAGTTLGATTIGGDLNGAHIFARGTSSTR